MVSPRIVTISLAISIVSLPRLAEAQETRSLAAVADRLETGDCVSVTDATGRKTTGIIVDLQDTSLSVQRSCNSDAAQRDATRTYQAGDIRKIVLKDRLRNGALIGLVVGAVPGVILGAAWKTYCTNEASSCPAAPLVFAGVFGAAGAGIGAGVDGLIHPTVYDARNQASVSIVPAFSRQRVAIRLSIRY